MTSSATVLRGMTIASTPRALERPGRGAAAPSRTADAPPSTNARAVADAEGARARERILDIERQEGRAQGYAEGHEAGMKDGKRQGAEEALRVVADEAARRDEARRLEEAERQDQLQRLSDLIDTFAARFEAHLVAAEDDLLGLCFESLARVLGEDALRADVLTALVRQSIRDGAVAEGVCIHVHPEDLARVQADPVIAARLASRRSVRWVADEQVSAGGCAVVSAQGSVDARLETQLARLAALFLRSRDAGAAA